MFTISPPSNPVEALADAAPNRSVLPPRASTTRERMTEDDRRRCCAQWRARSSQSPALLRPGRCDREADRRCGRIPLYLWVRAAARAPVAEETHGHGFMAATSMKRAGKEDVLARRDSDAPLLERLTKRLEYAAVELGQLIEKQHAIVGKADFTGARNRPATNHGDLGNRVMRRTERAVMHQGRARRKRPRD